MRVTGLPLFFAVVAISVLGRSHAAEPEFYKMMALGPPQKRINIVFIADGYTQEQKNSFIYIASKAMIATVSTDPFRQYKNYLNFYGIWAPSNQTGISGAGVTVDNYWGSSSCGICTCIGKKAVLESYLNKALPEWTVAVLIYRDDAGRGFHTCAGRITSTPDRIVNAGDYVELEQVNVIVHEFGHTIADLADEHELLAKSAISKVNANWNLAGMTRFSDARVRNTLSGTSTSRDLLPWKEWVNPLTPIPTPDTGSFKDSVGAFSGVKISRFRPQLKCKMRNTFEEFCAVCREGVILSMYRNFAPVDSFLPPPGTASLTTLDSISAIPLPRTATLRYTWTVDNAAIPVAASGPTLKLGSLNLSSGQHTISCVVEDTTNWVRIYKNHDVLKSRATWEITINETGVKKQSNVAHDAKVESMSARQYLLNGKFLRVTSQRRMVGSELFRGIYIDQLHPKQQLLVR